ncbi:MAG TPA: flavodoxin domain-containing protein [Cellulomonas sp.]|uniref:flavodoxin domain-containing protein n=1 Tax=Cellulomonas sp. TaxID=40001 RepID=UPI002E336CCF|nr:flavodoxin domain-containing protein [Cellulomonas sp.]HEX5331735.1 flavodoxin domain-containing protein [Cellulomonas sp.]
MKILVTVASRHGATKEIGTAIAAVLSAAGHSVDELDPALVTGVTGYDAVVLGSAVYTAHWLPAARDFAAKYADDLARRPVWIFSSGLATQPAARANSPHEMLALRDTLGARGHRSFAGRLDRSVLAFTERSIIAGARAREGDHRDFGAIAAWAGQIAAALSEMVVRTA